MFGWQFGPEKEIGLTKNTDPDGIIIVEASTLQVSIHAASNACIMHITTDYSLLYIHKSYYSVL